uniref:Rad21/Rec8-like protein N-terminal domain-containing protein n=1 Tax=Poecilia formosa TaxID=48698 RepID=A0A087XTS5_POEFO
MFYYPNVLQRHTGCFSTIWLAATGGIRVTRREFLRVNVKRTCNDILDYVTGQVPALEPDQSRPRFSLYLSSQLQYGVVIIYHKQCAFLLEEVQQTIDRWLRFKRRVQIDLAESDRMALNVPDGLSMMEEAEGALDPFFGLMASHQLPSPYKIVPTEFAIEDLVSQHSVVSSPTNKPDNKVIKSPLAAITLTEKEQFVINTAERQDFNGAELPEATARDIQLLMDQPDHFRREDEETKDRTGDQAVSSFGVQLKDTMLGTEQDVMWLLDEETGEPVEVPLAAVASEVTPEHIAMPPESEGDRATESLCDEAVGHPLRTHGGRRRRQLVFVDPEVQIPDKEIQQQIEDPLIETLNMSLWKQRASIAIQSESGATRRAEEESEQDMEILRTERKRRHSRMKEMSSQSGLQTTEGSSVLDAMLEMPDEDKFGSDVMTPVSRWSPHEDVQPPMEPIAEENMEMPEAQTDTHYMLSWIASIQQRFGEVAFDSLLPPKADRCTAARTLNKLLGEEICCFSSNIQEFLPEKWFRSVSSGERLTHQPHIQRAEDEGGGTGHRFKLAADKKQASLGEGEAEPTGRKLREPQSVMVRVEVEQDIPMSVALPIELQADGSHQAFPFLDTTLADLGIQESDVKERVVWVDTKKTQVKNKAGKLKEKETTILEVRVKAKKPGDKQLQEVLYSTEAHTDRSFCRTGMDIQPWKQGDPGKNKLKPVEMTMTLGLEKRQPGNTEAEDQRDI